VRIMLGGPGITETCLKLAKWKPMVTMAGQDLKSVVCAPMCLQWKPMWYFLLCIALAMTSLDKVRSCAFMSWRVNPSSLYVTLVEFRVCFILTTICDCPWKVFH
jgi:hypothetical protein